MKILILTAQSSWPSSYSLSNVTIDQVRGLKQLGHDVVIKACKSSDPLPSEVGYLWPHVRHGVAIDSEIDRCRISLQTTLDHCQPDLVISHDLTFQAGFIPYARAIHLVSDKSRPWLHYVHSMANGRPEKGLDYSIRSIPDGHFVVALGDHCVAPIARYYRLPTRRVITLDNPVDPGRIHGWSDRVYKLHNDYGFGMSEITCVLPFCATRAPSKGISHVAEVFDRFEEMGVSSTLLLAVSSANGPQEINFCRSFAAKNILCSSLIFPDISASGFSHRDMGHLLGLSSVHFNLSKSEACSLTTAEASLAGLPIVYNRNLPAFDGRVFGPSVACRYNTTTSNVSRKCSDELKDPEVEYSRWVAEQTVQVVRSLADKSKALAKYSPVNHARLLIAQVMEKWNGQNSNAHPS